MIDQNSTESNPPADNSLEEISGIHHVTGIAREAQLNVDFYTTVLGLRLVKQTVNFNDRFTRHLYYGDETGTPGTVLTFFPYPEEVAGRVGPPQISAASLVIPRGSIEYWLERLTEEQIVIDGAVDRLDETVLKFRDPEGTSLELVTGDSPNVGWCDGPVPTEYMIRGIHGVTILSANRYATASLLEIFGFSNEGQCGDRVRYVASGEEATVIDLLDTDKTFGREGVGSFHHVALRVPNETQLFDWHKRLRELGYDVSRVMDRHFFHSLYVRDPGGILFELATDDSSMTPDKAKNQLYLPDWLEQDRELIEQQLPRLTVDNTGSI